MARRSSNAASTAKRSAPRRTARPAAKKAKPAKRGSYAVIGPATRAKILDAAFKCILERGYHGTTTLLVQKRARVSRGSLLNQFPTKADLMTALSVEIIKGRSAAFREAMLSSRDYRERFERMMDVQWSELLKPGGVARLEILVAAVSDPELMKRFEPHNSAMDAGLRDETWKSAQQLGITDRPALDNLITQSMAALRGLALDLLYPRPGCDTEAAFKLIKATHMEAVDRLIEAGRAEAAPKARRVAKLA